MYKKILIAIIISIIFCISIASADIVYKARFANHTVCIDDSINENHGTYSNTDFDLGIINGAAVFNGINSYITIPHHSALTFSDGLTDYPFSISFWINIQNPQEQNPIILKGYNIIETEYIISTEGENPHGNIILYDQSTGYSISCVTQDPLTEYVTCNDWLHVIITYDGSASENGLNMYFNGAPKLCDRFGHPGYLCMTPTTADLQIGRESAGIGSINLQAKLDEVIIYNHEISSSEASFIYNSYICKGYTFTLLKKNNILGSEGNISVFRNNEYIETLTYGDSILLNNTFEYSFLIHEDMTDSISDINNMSNLSNTGITYLVYIIVIIAVIALLVYLYRKF